jgi:NAD(P)H-hydrate epimerase
MKILDARQMRKADERAIQEYGIHGLILMENAGIGVVRALSDHVEDLEQKRIVVLCGKGNNGGDGFVITRHLKTMGLEPRVILLARVENLQGDARINADIAHKFGIPIREVPDQESWKSHREEVVAADILVDAILGTGLEKPVSGFYSEVISAINASSAWIVSVDVPSGLSSDKGEIIGPAVDADLTVTFACPKYCHVFPPAENLVGDVVVADISMPDEILEVPENYLNLVDEEMLSEIDLNRPNDSHKGNYGHLLVISGSRGKSGAAWLTGFSALRIGAGLVTVATPRGTQPIVASLAPELMTEALAETAGGGIAKEALGQIPELLEGKNSLALGPGLSLEEETQTFIRELLRSTSLPCVVDADGLNALAGRLDILKSAPRPLALTPHPGEMARLIGKTASEIQADRVGISRAFAVEYGVHLVLKGYRTLVAAPDGQVFINPTGNPGMATGGSGDVLTGMLAGLIAQKIDTTRALILGVYLHGLAGDLAMDELGQNCLTATDLLDFLPDAMKEIGKA